MSTRKITIYKCDRCGVAENCRDPAHEYDWAKISAAQANGSKWIGDKNIGIAHAKDICPSCMDELMSWWHRGPEKATEASA